MTGCLELIHCCATPSQALQAHSRIQSITSGDIFLCNKLIQMYGRCSTVSNARRVFDSLPRKDSFSWDLLLNAYVLNGVLAEAQRIFAPQERHALECALGGICPDWAYARVRQDVRVCGMLREWTAGSLPAAVWQYSFDVATWNGMLAAYARAGRVEESTNFLEEMPERSLVSCTTTMFLGTLSPGNSMLAAYASHSCIEQSTIEEIQHNFNPVPEQGLFFNTMLSAYSQHGHLTKAIRMFVSLPQHESATWNTVLTVYAGNGHLGRDLKLLALIPVPDMVSYAGMLPYWKCEARKVVPLLQW
ncbi:pentatricopeptide repeat-containing protein At4g02750-like [Selaginella moellendorffii]|uniref:pentatricopeptide repeat-containing protein At4g02750-like n=1 Tax=Selaginella moellendorffii TaxID=88036 RepID=UPI000D1CE1D0|nr:pentatricopeptide repeat-containing protein At4g02750-like [Selaginella moellendorffii]|eukprot:XP_024518277.1 pentatricopeptide repeat-containing protein At4g02750-like [Selaginella moellendorffii]